MRTGRVDLYFTCHNQWTMRIKILTLFLVLLWSLGFSQKHRIDSLMLALKNAPNDATRYQMSDDLYGYYEEVDRDSALYYAEMAIMLAKRDGQNLVLASSLSWKALVVRLECPLSDILYA